MKIKITLFCLLITSITFSQFPGERTKETQTGPDKNSYKIKDVIQLGNALNGETFRNIFAYKHKSVLDNIDDALALDVVPSYDVFEDKDNNMIIKGEYIIPVSKEFNGFKGKIRYFKRVKSENNYYTFAIIKVPNSQMRLAVPLQSAILTGEMISKNKAFVAKEIVENKVLDEIKIKSFSNDYDLKLLSCKGDKNTQQVKIEFLIKHKKVHQDICFNKSIKDAKAYDLEGNEYNSDIVSVGSKVSSKFASYMCNKVPTNIPVKASINFIKILPTVEKLSFVTIKIGYKDSDGGYKYEYGNIEVQNLDIDWEN
ncbi:hypothetical protein [Polaribacter sp. NJDZ03]|uniref:hypothetical protein n=1 Tax=Polaribacter sp. NJDZ03 TaxID=2855841 RepID=UPI001C49CBC1|nr:hypothetical protein [Polaribacter sp. NJDZ03]